MRQYAVYIFCLSTMSDLVLATRKTYLSFDVFVRGRRYDGEADEKNVRQRIGEFAQFIVLFETRCVIESQCVLLTSDGHRHRRVVKHLYTGWPKNATRIITKSY